MVTKMAMIEVSEETLTQFRGVGGKISVLCATVQEKGKRCEQHKVMTAGHETRLRKIITLLCSVGALIVAIIAVMKQYDFISWDRLTVGTRLGRLMG